MHRLTKAALKGCFVAVLITFLVVGALMILADSVQAQIDAEVSAEISVGSGYRDLDEERYTIARECAQHYMVYYGEKQWDPAVLSIMGEDTATDMVAIQMYHDPRLGITLCSDYQEPKRLDDELYCFWQRSDSFSLVTGSSDRCEEIDEAPPIPEGTFNLLTTAEEEDD